MSQRQWLPNFAELIDRLSIHQLKEVFISEHKGKYKKEMIEIAHDIQLMIDEGELDLSSDLIRAIVVIAQINTHIWYNESNARNGKVQDPGLLQLTHGLNGIRNRTMNYILSLINDSGRRDWKIDCLADGNSEWDLSLFHNDEEQ